MPINLLLSNQVNYTESRVMQCPLILNFKFRAEGIQRAGDLRIVNLQTSGLHISFMMFVLVHWIDEKLFSVVKADDVVLNKFNGVLKVGITCPVKWRERRSGKKVEERLYDARIKAISGTLHLFFLSNISFQMVSVCAIVISRSVMTVPNSAGS